MEIFRVEELQREKKENKSLPDSNDRRGRVFVGNVLELFVFKWGK